MGVGALVDRAVAVGRGVRVGARLGVRVSVDVGDGGTGVGETVAEGEAPPAATDVIGGVETGLTQLGRTNANSSNVRSGTLKCKRRCIFFTVQFLAQVDGV